MKKKTVAIFFVVLAVIATILYFIGAKKNAEGMPFTQPENNPIPKIGGAAGDLASSALASAMNAIASSNGIVAP